MPLRHRRRESDDADGPFLPPAMAERLTDRQRIEMRRHFALTPRECFRFECYVYLSRECRLRPQHRDYRGIADVQAIAKQRGLIFFFDAAQDRVDVEIWGSDPPPLEASRLPWWEQGGVPLADMRAEAREFAGDRDNGHAAIYGRTRGPEPVW